MGSIDEISNQLQSLSERISSHMESLDHSKMEISDVMNKAQEQFGKDVNGQNAVMSMSQALNALSSIDGSLYALKSAMDEYIGSLRK